MLGISNIRQNLDKLDDDEKGWNSIPSLGGNQELSIVSESGMYCLVLKSRKPQARTSKGSVSNARVPDQSGQLFN